MKGRVQGFTEWRSTVASVALSWFALALVVALLVASVADAAPGDLDPSFGNGRKVKMKLTSGAGQFASVAIDSRGRIVAAGDSFGDEHTPEHFVLARYRSNGGLDPSFGDGGIADTDVPGELSSMAIAPRGRIVAAGCTGGDFEVARFHSDGTPDDPFGHGGVVRTDLGGPDCAFWVGIDSRRRIVAVGQRGGNRRYGDGDWFALARYTSDGRLDPSFSGDGKTLVRLSPLAQLCPRRPGHLGGDRRQGSDRRNEYSDFVLARYKPDGSVDPSFDGGAVTTDFGFGDVAESVAIDPQGRIVAAGTVSTGISPRTEDFALARYKPDGSLDPSFGDGGMVTTDFGHGDAGSEVAIDSQGRIVAVGYAQGHRAGGAYSPDFGLARYKPNGSLDPSFGGDGRVTTRLGGSSFAQSVTIDSQARIVAAGLAEWHREKCKFGLAVYRSDGQLDVKFGRDGVVTTRFGRDRFDAAASLAIDSHGRIVAVGGTEAPRSDRKFAVARYWRSGNLDRSFSRNGKVTTTFGGDDAADSVVLDSGDRIVAAGGGGREADFALARYIGYRRR